MTPSSAHVGDLVLAINAGSSSVKFGAYSSATGRQVPELRYRGAVTGIGDVARFEVDDARGASAVSRTLHGATSHSDALRAVIDWISVEFSGWSIVAAGHRVVHGGDLFRHPVVVDDSVLAALESLVPLARSHQPHNLAAITALAKMQPGLTQVACFDTAFHQTQPDVARRFALPRKLHDSGVKRYGFHGISYEYVAGVLPSVMGPMADGKVVVAHLGHGASMCAMFERRSVATTMGLTVLDGLVMGRRCGSLDPGVIPFLLQDRGMTIGEVEDLLYRQSGLFGVSGFSSDLRELLTSDIETAADAVELFCYRIGRELGSLTAALGGLDALVFTGGIGEHAASIRSKVCADAAWLGIDIDDVANAKSRPQLSTSDSSTAVHVIPTDEEQLIAASTVRLVGLDG